MVILVWSYPRNAHICCAVHTTMSASLESSYIIDEESQQNPRILFPEIVNGKIKTEEFLTAARHVVSIIDKFGKIFAPIKYDMQGNIDLRNKYEANKVAHSTLQDMILLEASIGNTIIAMDALLWLRRGLHMILEFFNKIIEDHNTGIKTEDLIVFLKQAYHDTLERYHGWMSQQLFGLLSRMVPTRSQLLKALAEEKGNEESTIKSLEIFLINLRKNIQVLQKFYNENNLEDEARV
ncbi:glycolipid transfer protein isoform X2 [Prorops nasuta]|uniref:glycolipid transfer protein isoform X2 n=1 Tax=Prorops nasuta TaxID=863751 RepID=UPI0034CD9744